MIKEVKVPDGMQWANIVDEIEITVEDTGMIIWVGSADGRYAMPWGSLRRCSTTPNTVCKAAIVPWPAIWSSLWTMAAGMNRPTTATYTTGGHRSFNRDSDHLKRQRVKDPAVWRI